MLRLVSNADRSDWQSDYRLEGQLRGERDDGFDSHFGRPPRRRRSRAGRVLVSLLIAITLLSASVALYFAARSGALDGILGQERTAGQPQAAAAPPAATEAAPGEVAAAAASPVPDVPILVLLIRNALLALDQANATGNYAIFRQFSSPGLQAATTPAGIAEAFADLRSREVDLSIAASANPRLFAPPKIGEDGRLEVAGFFPGKGEQINFNMSFEPVDGRWRLFGIGVNPVPPAEAASEIVPITPPAEGVMPADAQLIALIRNAVVSLNQANMTGDYSVMRELGSPGFREANPPAKLAENFADLRARGIDLSPVVVIEPRLARAPAIDPRGYLRLTGFFPSTPEQVNFDLAFDFNNGAWRLFGIGVNTSVAAEAPVAAAPEPGAVPAGQTAAPPASVEAAPPAGQPAAQGADMRIGSLPVPKLRPQAAGSTAPTP